MLQGKRFEHRNSKPFDQRLLQGAIKIPAPSDIDSQQNDMFVEYLKHGVDPPAPPHSDKSNKERKRYESGNTPNADPAKQTTWKYLWGLFCFGYVSVFLVAVFQGFDVIEFNLKEAECIALVASLLGASSVHFLKRSTDYVYGN